MDNLSSKNQLKPGYLVIVTKWWKEGDVVPEGWTTIGELNAERVASCPVCRERAAVETSGATHAR